MVSAITHQTLDATVSDKIVAIYQRNTAAVLGAIYNGRDWIDIRTALGARAWRAQCAALARDAGYLNLRSVERHIALATRLMPYMGELEERLRNDRVGVARLYEITRTGTPAEAVEMFVARLMAGDSLRAIDVHEVRAQTVRVLDVEPRLLDRVRAGDVALPDAAALADALADTSAPATVRDIAVLHLPKPQHIAALAVMRPADLDAIRTSGTVTHTFTGQEIPISAADDATFAVVANEAAYERAQRQYAHIARAVAGKHGERVGAWTGTLDDVRAHVDPTKVYRFVVYEVDDEGSGVS